MRRFSLETSKTELQLHQMREYIPSKELSLCANGDRSLTTHSYHNLQGIDMGLGHLDYMIGVEAMLPEDRRVCVVVVTELKKIYDVVLRSPGAGSIGYILCFPTQDSSAFASLVKRRVPQALVILAHYCVVLDVLNTRWWMHGWPARVMTDIVATLPQQWAQWVEWPVQSILVKPHSPISTDGLLI